MDRYPQMTCLNTPCDFSALVGNAQAKKALAEWLQSRLVPQVLLFHGPRGVGKGAFALQLGLALLGSAKEGHPDLHVMTPDAEADQYPIAVIREMIAEVSLPPFQAPCKLFILHDVEKMPPVASNTLLKTLEEPPSDAQFILITSQPSLLLPTIISRCSKLAFHPISDEELTRFLMEKHSVSEGEAKSIALTSEGSIGKALARLSSRAVSLPLGLLFECNSYRALHQALNNQLKEAEELSLEQTDQLFEEMLYWIRQKEPLKLEQAIPLIAEARMALFHHLKLKTVFERLFIKYSNLSH